MEEEITNQQNIPNLVILIIKYIYSIFIFFYLIINKISQLNLYESNFICYNSIIYYFIF